MVTRAAGCPFFFLSLSLSLIRVKIAGKENTLNENCANGNLRPAIYSPRNREFLSYLGFPRFFRQESRSALSLSLSLSLSALSQSCAIRKRLRKLCYQPIICFSKLYCNNLEASILEKRRGAMQARQEVRYRLYAVLFEVPKIAHN